MTKATRLLNLLTLLKSRRRAITAASLADQLGVSERTIYRDIQALIQTGVQIDGEAGVGYLLQKGSTLPPLMFNEEELESLILGVRLVQACGDPALGSAADSALNKIQAILPDRMHYLKGMAQETLLVPDFRHPALNKFSEGLRTAIKLQLKVKLDYVSLSGEQSTRTLWPLGLVFWGSAWTLVAWCELRHDHRMFRLDRIQEMLTLDACFSPSPEQTLQHYLGKMAP